jgi:ribosomal protein S27AE
LRRECPNENCGAGVFMANHFDRQYCGKCSLTYVYNKPEEGGAPAAAPAAKPAPAAKVEAKAPKAEGKAKGKK